MKLLSTYLRGKSLTVCFAFPEDYDMANIDALNVSIGSKQFTGDDIDISGQVACVRLKSEDTYKLTGDYPIIISIDDKTRGVIPIPVGDIRFVTHRNTLNNASTNEQNDIVIALSITQTTINVDSVLYDVMKGDKGDAGTIEVGAVTTGDAGTDVFVENVGTPSESVLNFTIPRGDAGYTPYIGVNGNWFINGVDTGVQAEGDATQQWVTDNFVEKAAGKSLIADTEITKLATIDFTQEKTTPIDADSVGLWDSVAVKFVRTTLTNFKAFLKTYFDTLYEKLTNKQNSLAVDGTGVKYPTVDTLNANFRSYTPTISYGNRVLADSGVISDLEKLTKLYVENLKLLPNTVYMWDGSAGIKTRTSGANTFATKLYDMSAGNRDAVQVTEANQPFVGGGIAPNEKMRLKANAYVAPAKSISHQSINIGNNNPFTVTYVLKHNNPDGAIINSQLVFGVGGIRLGNATIILNTGTRPPKGSTIIIQFVGDSSGGRFYMNGVSYPVTAYNPANIISLTNILSDISGYQFDGEIYHYSVFNKALSPSEIQSQYAYLRLQYPEIEGIAIGNQFWATSNYEGVVTGNGTVIPEVQDNAAWSALTTPAWCYYNNNPLNGAVYGKLYNWYAVQAIAANPPQGWRVPTVADMIQLQTYLGGVSVAGGKMKKEGLSYFNTPNTGATNESGFSAIGGGMRKINGDFTYYKVLATMATSDKHSYNTYYGYCCIYNNAEFNRSSQHEYTSEKSGQSIRLIRNEPVGATERTIETGYITNALGVTNLDIAIPFGYQIESVRIDSETDITGLSATLLTGGLVALETLFTAKSVTANVQKVISADADQSIQQTDAVVRINGTKADTTKRFRVWVKLTKVVFS